MSDKFLVAREWATFIRIISRRSLWEHGNFYAGGVFAGLGHPYWGLSLMIAVIFMISIIYRHNTEENTSCHG